VLDPARVTTGSTLNEVVMQTLGNRTTANRHWGPGPWRWGSGVAEPQRPRGSLCDV